MRLLFLLLLLPLSPSLEAGQPLSSRLEVAFQDVFPGEQQYVATLSFDGKEFTNAFNATADRTRLVLVFSPT